MPIGPTPETLFGDALRPLFGENLAAYHAEVERHDAESRELIDRARRVTQELLGAALDRLTFFGGGSSGILRGGPREYQSPAGSRAQGTARGAARRTGAVQPAGGGSAGGAGGGVTGPPGNIAGGYPGIE